jgi:hypothetical protein
MISALSKCIIVHFSILFNDETYAQADILISCCLKYNREILKFINTHTEFIQHNFNMNDLITNLVMCFIKSLMLSTPLNVKILVRIVI